MTILRGAKTCDQLPLEWQKIVWKVIGMRLRSMFGVRYDDRELSEPMRLAIEAYQIAENKKSNEKPPA